MNETDTDAEFVSGKVIERDGAQHWAAIFHDHVNNRIAKSEREMRKEIGQRVIAPLEAAINKLNLAVHEIAAKQANVDPALSAALRAYIDVMINEALNADAATAAKANKLFVDGLIAKALVPLVGRIKALEVKKVGA